MVSVYAIFKILRNLTENRVFFCLAVLFFGVFWLFAFFSFVGVGLCIIISLQQYFLLFVQVVVIMDLLRAGSGEEIPSTVGFRINIQEFRKKITDGS